MKAADQTLDPPTNQSKLKQAIMMAKHHDDRWTRLIAKWSPAISTKQKGTGTTNGSDQPTNGKTGSMLATQHNCSSRRQHRSHTRHDVVHFSTRRLDMGLHGKRLYDKHTPATTKTHDEQRAYANRSSNNRINNAHGHNQRDTKPKPRAKPTTATMTYHSSF